MQNINIYAAIANWKANKSGEVPIHISIDIDGKRAAFPSLKKRIKPTQWDAANRRVSAKHPNATVLNALINQKILEYQSEFTKKQLAKVKLTKASVKKQVKSTGTNLDFYRFAIEQVDIKNYSAETRRSYMSEISKMQQFAPALAFADITFGWLQKYDQYMRDSLSNHPNTVWKSLKFLNTMLNTAIKVGGYLEQNPFDNYDRGNYKQGIPGYIEWAEAQKLHKVIAKDPLSDHLRLIGYYSLLSYYSGLRFGDAIKFDYARKVAEDSKGKRMILYTSKTGEIVSIKFTKYIDEVVEYIKDKPIISNTTGKLITNQEFNEGLKTLAGIAKIKPISSHDMRHGFAMRCAELGMSIDDVQKLMGHTKRTTTEIYFRIKSTRLDDAMKVWEQ